MQEKILLVDDEPAVLQGYQRLMRIEFDIETATSGAEALAALARHGEYAVVVSDMRMPEMDGVQLLTRFKSLSPDTVRIMLTGQADLEAAIHAVNEGNIFRFLAKPCAREVLAKALNAGLVQHRLVTADKYLLEKTLAGSVQVLSEVLSLVNPAAFSRAMRIRRYISQVAAKMKLGSPWRYEVAAMMSQLGCVTLHPETIEAVYAGKPLPPEEQARFDDHPKFAADLLSTIPRLEPIAWMIAHQNDAAPAEKDFPDSETASAVQLGADILRATLLFDDLLAAGSPKQVAAREVRARWTSLDHRICDALSELELEGTNAETADCPLDDLATGMVLRQEVRSERGLLIAAKGQEVTYALILKLKSTHERGAIPGTVAVSRPSV